MKKLFLSCMSLIFCITLYSQDKVEPRVDVTYTYINSQLPKVGIRVRNRVNKRFFPMPGVMAKIYFQEESEDYEIAEVTTNDKGEAAIELPERFLAEWLSLSTFDLLAVVDPTDSIEETSESITIKKARLIVDGNELDGVRTVTAIVEQFEDSVWIPSSEVELKLFIKRDFGRLPLGEDFYETNESGVIEAEFDTEVPGDQDGKVAIGAFVEDHDEFGNLFAYKELNWGIPTVDDNSEFNKRTLWATSDKTPIWLLIFPNLMILGVWSTIGYVLLQIFRLKKLAKQ